MDWNELSREISRETGYTTDGFSQDGQHPWVIAAIRIATLREREAIAQEAKELGGAITVGAILSRSN